MANLLRTLAAGIQRSDPTLSWQRWVDFAYNGNIYGAMHTGTLEGDREAMATNFEGFVNGAYKGSSVVFAVMHTRTLHLSEIRFAFQRLGGTGIPGADLFTSNALAPLDSPWENGTTGDLVARMSVDADLAGNAYVYRPPGSSRLFRRRPDWMTIVLQAPDDHPNAEDPDDAELVAYAYTPGGPASGNDPVIYEPRDVAHYAPLPDPLARYRGTSWIEPIVQEILGDRAATLHKQRYFQGGATPNVIVMLPQAVRNDNFKTWVDAIRSETEGPENAGKTMFLGAGATATVAGNSLREVSFKEVQGAGETRIAAAASTPPVIVGLSEGLGQATYSNYQQARRRFGDGTCRPLWRKMAASLATVLDVPAGAELMYDASAVAFLREDEKDVAEVRESQTRQIRTLIDGGYEPDAAVEAVVTGDFSRLRGNHSGLAPVQVQPRTSSQNGDQPTPTEATVE